MSKTCKKSNWTNVLCVCSGGKNKWHSWESLCARGLMYMWGRNCVFVCVRACVRMWSCASVCSNTHEWARVRESSVTSQSAPAPTHWHTTVSKALPKQANTSIRCLKKKKGWLQSNLPNCNSQIPTQRFLSLDRTRQRPDETIETERVVCRNVPIWRQRPKNNHKAVVRTEFMKGRVIGRDPGGPQGRLVLGKAGWSRQRLLFRIGPCRHSGHRVNTVTHCTMPLGRASSRPDGGFWKKLAAVLLFNLFWWGGLDRSGQVKGFRERI